MALVAYDYSDDSDDAESDSIAETRINSKDSSVKTNDLSIIDTSSKDSIGSTASATFKLPASCSNNTEPDDDDDSESDDDEPIDISFSNLPKPQYDILYVDESKVKSAKSAIWKKLISAPRVTKAALTEKKRKWVEKNNESGLLSMLPNPTHEFSKGTKIAIPTPKLLPTAVKNKMKITKKQDSKKSGDDDDESDVETDFFSLSNVDKVNEYDISATDLNIAIEDPMKEVNVPKVSEFAKYLREDDVSVDRESVSMNETNSNPDSHNALDLDEDAVLALCGRKRKGQIPEDIQVIDIHEDAVLAETKRNLTKRLTEEVSYRPMRSGGPSSLSKRKHQITYLAFQAKERELELKNQWANNRFTKKQTQSKYGF